MIFFLLWRSSNHGKQNLWRVCLAVCCEGLSGLAVGLFLGISLDLWAATFPPQRQPAGPTHTHTHTHEHTPVLRLRALHYLRQSSSTSNPAAISAGQKKKMRAVKNVQKQEKGA